MNRSLPACLASICDCILDESCSPAQLQGALDDFAQLCGNATDIHPDPSFDAWAEDSLLADGVAINPQAAAHCVLDYQRSVVFIRGIYAALKPLRVRLPDQPLTILYAGCGPFATLLLPLLGRFEPGELNITLLDIHQRSLDSVNVLLHAFELDDHTCHTVRGDACHYQHESKLQLIIAETMQKSLEQEPQFPVTVNLASQLQPGGVFIPQLIEVELGLTDLAYEKSSVAESRSLAPDSLQKRHPLATVFSLSPDSAAILLENGQYNANTENFELNPLVLDVPPLPNIATLDAALFTRISVFEQYRLDDYESEITLPLKCHELLPLAAGEQLRVSYQLGSYPKFNIRRINSEQAPLHSEAPAGPEL